MYSFILMKNNFLSHADFISCKKNFVFLHKIQKKNSTLGKLVDVFKHERKDIIIK